MRVRPVLDLLSGRVVRARGGERQAYHPLHSSLLPHADADPLMVAEGLRSAFGFQSLYVACLDPILGLPFDRDPLTKLIERRFSLAVDVGLRRASEASEWMALGVDILVAGLETLERPDELAPLVQEFGPDRVLFSLDLLGAAPMGDRSTWPERVEEILESVWRFGVRRVLILDLQAVGTTGGVRTVPWVEWALDRFDGLVCWTGGGVRTVQDLVPLERAGVEEVLVATALHDGRLTPSDLAALPLL